MLVFQHSDLGNGSGYERLAGGALARHAAAHLLQMVLVLARLGLPLILALTSPPLALVDQAEYKARGARL